MGETATGAAACPEPSEGAGAVGETGLATSSAKRVWLAIKMAKKAKLYFNMGFCSVKKV
jgi:hypothetical protein